MSDFNFEDSTSPDLGQTNFAMPQATPSLGAGLAPQMQDPFAMDPSQWDQETRSAAAFGDMHNMVDQHYQDTGVMPDANTLAGFNDTIIDRWGTPETANITNPNMPLNESMKGVGFEIPNSTIQPSLTGLGTEPLKASSAVTASTPTDAKTKPADEAQESTWSGDATFYNLPGNKTASGKAFDPDTDAAAMYQKGIKLGDKVRVFSKDDPSKYVDVTVNDTGPFQRGTDGKASHPLQADPKTVIDLTPSAFKKLVGSLDKGRVSVTVKKQ